MNNEYKQEQSSLSAQDYYFYANKDENQEQSCSPRAGAGKTLWQFDKNKEIA